MRATNFKVLFMIRASRKAKSGQFPIYCRITLNGTRAEFSIGEHIPAKNWNQKKGEVIGKEQEIVKISERMDMIKHRLFEQFYQIEKHGEEMTAENVKFRYLGIPTKSKSLVMLFEDHNKKCRALMGKDFAPATVERYECTLRHTRSFMKHKYRKDDIMFHEIKPEFINDFEFYLKTERQCSHNTSIKYLKNFKKIIRIALANGWMQRDPFAGKKFRLDEVDVHFLDNKELKTLMDKDFAVNRLEQVRDIYVFCCFTGLAFIDVKNLSRENIVEKEDGFWIAKKRQKTDNWSRIPLLKPALQIMQKYEGHPNLQGKDKILPVPTNQKMNAYLKEIADICGVNKKLCTHTARHTFATTVTLSNHVSMESVSKMLGHSSIKMTQKYARIVDDLIQKDMAKLQWLY